MYEERFEERRVMKVGVWFKRNWGLLALGAAALGTVILAVVLAQTTQTSIAEIPLAVIGGGLISTLVILLAERVKHDAEVNDLRHALASDLALNVVWAL
jgi:hypothetical protein